MSKSRFDRFMNAWVCQHVLGLPLRMIFVCDWHRRHAVAIFVGWAIAGLGYVLSIRWLASLGLLVMAPSMLCMLLLPVLAIVFIGLEWLTKTKNDG